MAEKIMLEIESGRRTLDEHRVIHFCKEGNFYRAYEFSAWLAFRFAGELNVTRRYSKAANGDIMMVGFPLASLPKFTPEGVTPVFSEDGQLMTMTIPAYSFKEDETLEKLKEEFKNWKHSVEASNKKGHESGGGKPSLPEGKPQRLTSIMHKMLAYPIEQSSPMECMSFLAEMKKEISELI